jgi:hypothetical protein
MTRTEIAYALCIQLPEYIREAHVEELRPAALTITVKPNHGVELEGLEDRVRIAALAILPLGIGVERIQIVQPS